MAHKHLDHTLLYEASSARYIRDIQLTLIEIEKIPRKFHSILLKVSFSSSLSLVVDFNKVALYRNSMDEPPKPRLFTIKFWLLLSLSIPSTICSIFIFVYFCQKRKKLSAHHRFAFLLVLISFLQITTDLPFVMIYYRRVGIAVSYNSFCLWWDYKRQRRRHWPRNSHSTMSCQSSVTRKPCSSWRKANWSPRSTTAVNRMPRSVTQYSLRSQIADFVVPAVFLRETSSCYCPTTMTMMREEFLEEHEYIYRFENIQISSLLTLVYPAIVRRCVIPSVCLHLVFGDE